MPTPMGDCHRPDKLTKDFSKNKKAILKAISDGMTPKDAVQMIFGINDKSWYNWVNWTEEDLADGYTSDESRLIDLMESMSKAHLGLRRKLEKKANELALDEEHTDMLKFMLERRHGYKKETKKDVDVAVKENAPIKFEFVDMTPTENED